jgi:4-amino-4-deoxy-L-arabinose transferase-like glycosyltransferase
MSIETSRPKKSSFFWLTLILLLGFALRVYALGDVAINNDESIEYTRWISKSFQAITVDDLILNNHTLAQILARLSILVLGDTAFSLRWPALGMSVLGIVFIYKVAQNLFGVRAGLVSALLLAVSPYAIFYAHALRGYSAVVSLPLLIYLLAWLALRSRKRRYWLAFVLASVAALYTHLFTIFALANVVFILGLMQWQNWRLSKSDGRWLPALTLSLAVILALLAVCYAPIWYKTFKNMTTSGVLSSAGVLWVQRPQVPASLWTNLQWFNGLEKGSFGQAGLYPFLGLVSMGVWSGWIAKRRAEVSILLAWAFLPFMEIWLLRQILAGFWARPQYLGYTLPPLLILASLALAQLPAYRTSKKKWIPAGLSLGFFTLMILFWCLTIAEFYQNYTSSNWQLTGNFLRRHATQADLVVCQRYQQSWRLVDLDPEDFCTRTLNYRRQADVSSTIDIITSYELVYKLLPTLNAGMVNRQGRVWVVVWDVPPDVSPAGLDFPVTEFNRFGRSFILLADQEPTYVANLAQALNAIRATTQGRDQQFIYSSMIAPLAAASNQAEAAQAALALARQNQPEHPDSGANLQMTEQLVQTLSGSVIEHPLAANFGGKIQFQGYNIDPAVLSPGTTLHLTLFWSVLNSIQEDYTVFMHLRDQSGKTVGQFDYQPFGQAYSTKFWQPGQFLADQQQFTIPANFSPGEYNLVIGFYNPQTLERLPLINDQSGENALLLTQLRILD